MVSCSDDDWIEGSFPSTQSSPVQIAYRTLNSQIEEPYRDVIPHITPLICLVLFSSSAYNRTSISEGGDKQ
jgi:hypothetical protein